MSLFFCQFIVKYLETRNEALERSGENISSAGKTGEETKWRLLKD